MLPTSGPYACDGPMGRACSGRPCRSCSHAERQPMGDAQGPGVCVDSLAAQGTPLRSATRVLCVAGSPARHGGVGGCGRAPWAAQRPHAACSRSLGNSSLHQKATPHARTVVWSDAAGEIASVVWSGTVEEIVSGACRSASRSSTHESESNHAVQAPSHTLLHECDGSVEDICCNGEGGKGKVCFSGARHEDLHCQ